MKEAVLKIVGEYLKKFPEEKEKVARLEDFLKKTKEAEIGDWNNFYGHLVSSAFIYAKKEKKFLVLYHKDFESYVYPGGHMEKEDSSILETAKREIREETGIKDLQEYGFVQNKEVPIDINIHRIPYNEKLDLPEHLHFDFCYFFVVDKVKKVIIDHESRDYKWIGIEEFTNHQNFGINPKKIEQLVSEVNEVEE